MNWHNFLSQKLISFQENVRFCLCQLHPLLIIEIFKKVNGPKKPNYFINVFVWYLEVLKMFDYGDNLSSPGSKKLFNR